jgi:hypothetical protein
VPNSQLPYRFPHIAAEELEAIGAMDVELVDGDLYIGGRNYGHGAWARAVLAPQLAGNNGAPPRGFISQLWDALR